MTIEIDRRAFPRQAPASRETYVWIADMAAQKAIMARLLNIGSGGALVETHALAPTDRVLQVGLVNAPDVGWLEAIIVRFEHTNRIALRFDPRASLDFISAAISGSKPTRDGIKVKHRCRVEQSKRCPSRPIQGIGPDSLARTMER